MGLFGKLLGLVRSLDSYWDHRWSYYEIQKEYYRNLHRKQGQAYHKKAKDWTFTLRVDGFTPETPRLEDALVEMECDDATLAFRGGVAYLTFDRRAPTLEMAVAAAGKDISLVARIVGCETTITLDGGE